MYETISLFLVTPTTATWPLPSNEGCRPPYTTSKHFRRAYELQGSVRGDPWCGRPARYVRFQNQQRRVDPSTNILKQQCLNPSTNVLKSTATSQTKRQHLKPNCVVSKLVPTFRNQRRHLKPNRDISKLMPTFRNQLRNLEFDANIPNRTPTL